LFLLAGLALAKPAGVTGQEFPFDQVHIAVPDVEEAVAWYRNVLGGLPVPGEPANRLFFGDTRVGFLRLSAPQPSGDHSIDHVGLVVADPTGTVHQVVESGGADDGHSGHAAEGLMIRDPWGTKLELRRGLGPKVDHVEIRSSDPPTEISWFRRMFGGEQTNLDGAPGLRFGEVVLSFSEGFTEGSEGTSFDHIGWRTDDIEETALRLRGDSVRFLSDIEPRGPVIRVVFVESPSGVKVEILQR
jgi:catechol 2,3-dioxygenase-like lactoylglutathione lyase family enzyme